MNRLIPLTRSWLTPALTLSCVLAACSDTDSLSGDARGPEGSPDAGVHTPDGGGGTTMEQPVGDVAPLRRMTNRQVARSLVDLMAPVAFSFEEIPFANEVTSNGFDNQVEIAGVTPSIAESLHTASLQLAPRAWQHVQQTMTCEATEQSCVVAWAHGMAERAWRRPLTDADRSDLSTQIASWWTTYGDEEAASLALQYIILAPEFSYFPEFGAAGAIADETGSVPLSDHELAARLAAFLWNSIPDAALRADADAGTLHDPGTLRGHVMRMLSDPRAREAVSNFYRQAWHFDAVGTAELDAATYASHLGVSDDEGEENLEGFADELNLVIHPAMRAELEANVDYHLFEGDGRLGTLFTTHQLFVAEEVSWAAYDEDIDEDAQSMQWVLSDLGGPRQWSEHASEYTLYQVEFDPTQRVGFLGLAGWLNAHAKPVQPSPVQRGVFVLERMLCWPAPPPPGDVPPIEDTPETEFATNRERYAAHTSNPACAGCHQIIDGAGFPFENFDSFGRWRDQDNGHPVDASGQLLIGEETDVTSAADLANALAQSRAAYDCHVDLWLQHALGRAPDRQDNPVVRSLKAGFWDSEGHVLDLIANIAMSHTFTHIQRPAGGAQ